MTREAQLRDERRRTLEQISSLQRSFDDIVDSTELANDDEHDPDGSTIAFERAKVIALLGAARAQLEALDAAVARVAGGTDDVCERCGGPIGAERLHALPTTTVCVRCA